MSKCKTCGERFYAIMVDYLLASFQIPSPIFYLAGYSSSEETDIKNWIQGQNKVQFLIASTDLIKGFEVPFIIDLSFIAEVKSRASSQFSGIQINPLLEFVALNEQIFNSIHNCDDLLDRDKRPKMEFDIQMFIGKNSLKCIEISFKTYFISDNVIEQRYSSNLKLCLICLTICFSTTIPF